MIVNQFVYINFYQCNLRHLSLYSFMHFIIFFPHSIIYLIFLIALAFFLLMIESVFGLVWLASLYLICGNHGMNLGDRIVSGFYELLLGLFFCSLVLIQWAVLLFGATASPQLSAYQSKSFKVWQDQFEKHNFWPIIFFWCYGSQFVGCRN